MRPRSLILLAFAAGCAHAAAGEPSLPAWTKVGGAEFALSGVAFEKRVPGELDFIVIHDNKKPGQARIGRVTVTSAGAVYKELAWPAGELPIDVESVCAYPDHPGRFAALASAGRLFVVDVAGDTVTLAGPPIDFPKPAAPARPNYEGFCLQTINGRLAAVWADRGEKDAPARLFWGPFDETKGPTIAGSAEVRAPWPEADFTRDIADLKVDPAGVVWCTAAWDNDDDDATYRSAVYVIGVVGDCESRSGFLAEKALTPLRAFKDHKAEGLELLPGADGGLVLASDDENHGGWFVIE